MNTKCISVNVPGNILKELFKLTLGESRIIANEHGDYCGMCHYVYQRDYEPAPHSCSFPGQMLPA